jgi:hypothetical protein
MIPLQLGRPQVLSVRNGIDVREVAHIPLMDGPHDVRASWARVRVMGMVMKGMT